MFSLSASILSLCFCSAYSFKMVIFVMDLSNSQLLYNVRVAEALAGAGHDVTLALIAPQADRDSSAVKIPENIKVYRVNATIQFSRREMEEKQAQFAFKETSGWRLAQRISIQTSTIVDICRATLRRKEFLNWLERERFDLAYAHIFDVCTVGLVHAAKIPSWIWLSSGSVVDYVAYVVGIPTIPSYVPPWMMEQAGEMNFYQRTKSLIGHGLIKFFWRRLIADPETALFREMISADFPDLLDLASKCPLVMANTNDFYEIPRPTLAKVVNIGGVGMTTRDVKPLPKNIEEIMQKGDGIVLFSFGSVAAAHQMPKEWKVIFMETFEKLQNLQFLVRYEKDDLNDMLPENVHLFQWLPQSDILQHPKTKAFITHGGYNSVQEAIRGGVPIISIPLFGDQPKNARLAEHHGFGLILHRAELSVNALSEAIQKVVKNLKYAQSAKRLSRMLELQPVSPVHLLVKWSEFTAEFKTLENLEPAGNKLNFFQYHSLDVIAFLATVLIVILLVIIKVVLWLWRFVFTMISKLRKQKVA
uniref:UDP-glucuronosyltransferase n=1 Tax=Haemonchus contortus TaxID=6289 RepID=A0A7I5EBQ6_HAECO